MDSATAQVDINRNQIANSRSEVDTNKDNQNTKFLTITSGNLPSLGMEEPVNRYCVKNRILYTHSNHRPQEDAKQTMGQTLYKTEKKGTGMEHKKPNTQTTPTFGNADIVPARDTTLDCKEAKSFKTAFWQPTTGSPYYRDYARHLKIKLIKWNKSMRTV